MTDISLQTVRDLNRDYAGLVLSPARVKAVKIELDQLAAAIESVRALITFDSEPADFDAALNAAADPGALHD